MARARPVVAPRHSSIPEVGGDLLFYVDHLDPDDVARGIVRALAEPDGSERLTDANRRAAGFTWDRTVSATFDAYDAAIRRARP
jgi:glycosyltransferase involved in cell wall biosynthesis